jgi:hypothetical protein
MDYRRTITPARLKGDLADAIANPSHSDQTSLAAVRSRSGRSDRTAGEQAKVAPVGHTARLGRGPTMGTRMMDQRGPTWPVVTTNHSRVMPSIVELEPSTINNTSSCFEMPHTGSALQSILYSTYFCTCS